jgi:hypothetical protein
MEQRKLDKKFILNVAILVITFLLLLSQCTVQKKIKKIELKQTIIETEIKSQTEIYTTVLEQQFTNNMIYSQAIESKKLTTEDLQTKLLNLNNKIETVKKNQQKNGKQEK